MKIYVVAIDAEKKKEIQRRLKLEKKLTGKSIRRIVTDILMDGSNFLCLKNRENREKTEGN